MTPTSAIAATRLLRLLVVEGQHEATLDVSDRRPPARRRRGSVSSRTLDAARRRPSEGHGRSPPAAATAAGSGRPGER